MNPFDVLWSVLPHPEGSVVRLFARDGDHREGDFARSAREIRKFAKGNYGRNVYVAPNPTDSVRGVRHSAVEVTHWSYFLIDVDPVCTCPVDRKPRQRRCPTCRGEADPRVALEDALLWIGEWVGRDFGRPDNHPITIDSGRGCQAWIRLEDIPLLRETSTKKVHFGFPPTDRLAAATCAFARRVNGYWLKKLDERLGVRCGCRIDTSVSDLPRVMRCPGTVNVKTGRLAEFIHVTPRVFVGLAHLLSVGVPTNILVDPEPPAGISPGQPWQVVFPHLTRMAQNYLSAGQEEPGRHKVMWHTAKKLHELGVTREEANRALRWANSLKGKKEALPEDQVQHALDTAYES